MYSIIYTTCEVIAYEFFTFSNSFFYNVHKPFVLSQPSPHPFSLSLSVAASVPLSLPLFSVEIHQFKKTLPRGSQRDKPHTYDPIAPVARDVASSAHLLCFDEFQVRIQSTCMCVHVSILYKYICTVPAYTSLHMYHIH